jgi:hypothetical protein
MHDDGDWSFHGCRVVHCFWQYLLCGEGRRLLSALPSALMATQLLFEFEPGRSFQLMDVRPVFVEEGTSRRVAEADPDPPEHPAAGQQAGACPRSISEKRLLLIRRAQSQTSLRPRFPGVGRGHWACECLCYWAAGAAQYPHAKCSGRQDGEGQRE